MNSANISQIMLATIIIDVNGQIRTLAAGEQPRPGEVVVDLGEDLTNGNNIDVQLVESSGENVDITLDNEIAQLLEQIEAGEDPTQNPDLATAAGGQNGSSPTASGAVERTGAETLAATSFDTTGLESQGLSETQSLALLDLIGETLITSSGDTVINYFENSNVDTVLAIVNLAEFEGLEQSFSLQFEAGDPLADYFVINEAGEIRLTQAGVEAFTNDFETGPNSHALTVTVTAVNGQEQTVNLTLQELDVNEAPVFTLPPDDNDNGGDDNNGETDSESPGFVFEYSENSSTDDIIGQVAASDPDAGDSVTYSIIDNVVNSNDEPLYEIDSETGEISLTQAGVDAFTNDFEDVEGKNNHQILVGASDGELTTEIIVNLNENDVNEAPTFVDDVGDEVAAYTFYYDENTLYENNSGVGGFNENKIGQVFISDPDAGDSVTFTIQQGKNVFNENQEPLFEIDSEGRISLTEAGVAAFTNDFEDEGGLNGHQIVVEATDEDGLKAEIHVNLNENNVPEDGVNDAPIFTQDTYEFSYEENSKYIVSNEGHSSDGLNKNKIGLVEANDPEGGIVIYSIEESDNIFSNGLPLFEVDSFTGAISLTAAGVDAFTNDFEDIPPQDNQHIIKVTATDPQGNSSQVVIQLTERDVNEAPIAEDFSVDVDIEASTQIIFDSDNPDSDFISDVEDDISDEQVMVMVLLTSLPDYGTLYYTEGEVTREITSADLYSTDGPLATQFDPNFITYQIDESDKVTFVFGDIDGNSSTVGEWGEPTDATDTKRTFSLSNGSEIVMWITQQNGSLGDFKLYEPKNNNDNNNANHGYGIADSDGQGINGNGNGNNTDNGHETFHIDLSSNPLGTVDFGVDALNGGFSEASGNSVLVTYYLASGATETVEYQKDSGDTGNSQLYYEFSYSSPDDPVIFMEMIGNGANWVLRYLSGEEIPPSETSFDYVAVDSGQTQTGDPSDPINYGPQLPSEEATVTLNTGDNTYNIVFAANGGSLNGQLGNDVLVGDDQANVFTWLDSTLDNGRDVIVDFESGKDKLDLLDILSDGDGAEDLAQMLVTNLSVNGGNVELTVDNSGGDTQTIVFEDGATIFSSYISNDTIQASELLDNILKEPN